MRARTQNSKIGMMIVWLALILSTYHVLIRLRREAPARAPSTATPLPPWLSFTKIRRKSTGRQSGGRVGLSEHRQGRFYCRGPIR